MRFAFTSDQELLRDALRDVLQRECPPSLVRASWEKRDATDGSYIPARISFSATSRRTGDVCSASHTWPIPPSPSLRISTNRSANVSPGASSVATSRLSMEPGAASGDDSRNRASMSASAMSIASTSLRKAASAPHASSRKRGRCSLPRCMA